MPRSFLVLGNSFPQVHFTLYHTSTSEITFEAGFLFRSQIFVTFVCFVCLLAEEQWGGGLAPV